VQQGVLEAGACLAGDRMGDGKGDATNKPHVC